MAARAAAAQAPVNGQRGRTDDDPPAWQLECETTPPGDPRGNVCKAACGADQLCPGADQPTCELECNACAPDVAWCPAVSQ